MKPNVHRIFCYKAHYKGDAKALSLKWMKERNKLGGQYKVPRLANNRKHIEEILKLNE